MKRFSFRTIGLVLVTALLADAPACQAQTLSHSLPAAIEVGKSAVINVYGAGLTTARTLWTTFPATVAPAPGTTPTENQASFTVTVAAGVPVGVGAIRIVTESGISDPRPFVLDDLPVVFSVDANTTIDQAQPLPLPIAVDGTVMPETADFFAITVAAGQRLAFEVVGHRLGAGLDPLLTLYSPDKRALTSHDNDEGLGYDGRFEYVFKDAGVYYLELRDTRYQGGGNLAYHLRIGDFPVTRVAFPPGGTRGRWVSVAFPGRTATDIVPLDTEVSTNPVHTIQQLVAKGVNASAWVPFIPDDHDQQLELEPNNTPEAANAFLPGRTLNGRLEAPGDVDAFRFTATGGRPIVFCADTRRIASPADLYIRVLNAQGGEVQVTDDVGVEDAKFTFTPPADGVYTLTIEDLNRRGGPEFIYRLASTVTPVDFTLTASVDRLVLPRGSAVPVAIGAARAGYTDPINVEVQTGSVASQDPCVLPAGATSSALVLRAGLDAPLGIHTFRICGSGTVGERPLIRSVDLTGLVAPKLDNIFLIPGDLVTEIPVLITPPAFFRVAARVDAPAVTRFGKTPLTVQIDKQKFFDDEVAVEVGNLPPNVAVAAKPIAKGTRSITLEIESKKDSPLGRFPVFISGTATQRGRSARVFAEVLPLDIQPAFALAFAELGLKLARGAKASVTVKATRLPNYTGPIEVELKNLPAGVMAPKGQIPEKQDSVALELAAAPDAAQAAVENLAAVGTGNPGAAVETVTSPPARLAVE